jgi:hypothetical protein
MRLLSTMALLVLVAVGVVAAQPKSPAKERHPGYPPTLMLASASEAKGKVIVQIFRPGPAIPPVDPEPAPGDRYETEWVPLRPVILGESVRAFTVKGEPLDARSVLKELAKPKGAAIFLRSYQNDPLVPAPFYREMFRDGTVLLVAMHEDLYNPPPGELAPGAVSPTVAP